MAFTSVSPASLILQPGQSAQASVTVRNIGAKTITVKWTAVPEAGVAISPDHGSIAVAANSTATVPVTITAQDDAEGRYSIGVKFALAERQRVAVLLGRGRGCQGR